MIILWFCFTIIDAGPYNGWMRFNLFSECENDVNKEGSNYFGFPKFLCIVETFMYYITILLSIYVIVSI